MDEVGRTPSVWMIHYGTYDDAHTKHTIYSLKTYATYINITFL